MPSKEIKKSNIGGDRAEQLKELFKDVDGAKDIIEKLITDVVFLEARMERLRALPQIEVNPRNPAQQRQTVAWKQYKECLQQYGNCIKILTGILRKDSGEEESPLRAYLNSRLKND